MQNSRKIILSCLTVVLSLIIGTIGVYVMRDQFSGVSTWFDSLYYTMVTYTTLGSNITPQTEGARILVICLVLVGVGCFASVITLIVVPFIENKVRRMMTMIEHIEQAKNHYIICGVNAITIQIAHAFINDGKNVLLIAGDNSKASLLEAINVNYIIGDIQVKDVLVEAGIDNAQGIVCGLENDAQNILLLMMVEEYFSDTSGGQDIDITAIVQHPNNEDKARKCGANHVVVPAQLAADALVADINVAAA